MEDKTPLAQPQSPAASPVAEGAAPPEEAVGAKAPAKDEESPAKRALAQKHAALSAQLREARARYTQLDLQAEMQNPQFVSLLRAGADIRSAYEFVHREDIFRALVGGIAGDVRARVLRDIQARGARPAENGTAGRAPATLREPLPSEWSREERDRVGRAALRGVRHTIQLG